MKIEYEGREPYETDIRSEMAALGATGVLGMTKSGLKLTGRSDLLLTLTRSEDVAGLVGTDARTSRLRLALEASEERVLEGGARLVPSVELGVRVDGGDAETGAGLEAAAKVRYTKGAFTIEGAARQLLAHEEKGYEEWGASGSVRIDPGTSGRGLSFTLSQSVGSAASGVERLRSLEDAAGLGGNGTFDAKRALEAELGYGLAVKGTTLTPFTGLTLSEGGQRLRAGARWKVGTDATLSLEATRDENEAEPRHGLEFRAAIRW